MSKTAERRGATEHRRSLLHGLAGTVAEVGAGNGPNFAHYPAEVAEVIALEPEPTLRAAAVRTAADAPVQVRVRAGVARSQPKRLLLQALDRSGLWPKLAGGCHPARDTGAAIERAGFTIAWSDRIMFAASRFEPAIPHILGVARLGSPSA